MTYDLAAIKAAFFSPAKLHRTLVSARWAAALGMDAAAVVALIHALQYPVDFDKSPTAHHDPKRWHDSHKPRLDGERLDLKFTLDDKGKLLLTSFKEA